MRDYKNNKKPLLGEYEETQIYGIATLFLIFALFSFVFFALIVLLIAIGEKYYILKEALYTFEWIVFIFCTIPVVIAVKAQRSYKLRAVI
ncbi:hypothetical protein QUF50_07130 [Thiotrichales bacterium HSG1]|nr:hypothetical protein [Thiotrichales bacterium HSG1]